MIDVPVQSDNEVTPPPAEPTFQHTLRDGTRMTVGLPRGVLRIKLRNLLGDEYYKDEELKTMGTAFLSIRKWDGGPPAPLLNPNNFETLMARFKNDEDLDQFMEKWQYLTQPELSQVVKTALSEALEAGYDPERTRKHVQEATLPYAKKRLARLQDSPPTPSS